MKRRGRRCGGRPSAAKDGMHPAPRCPHALGGVPPPGRTLARLCPTRRLLSRSKSVDGTQAGRRARPRQPRSERVVPPRGEETIRGLDSQHGGLAGVERAVARRRRDRAPEPVAMAARWRTTRFVESSSSRRAAASAARKATRWQVGIEAPRMRMRLSRNCIVPTDTADVSRDSGPAAALLRPGGRGSSGARRRRSAGSAPPASRCVLFLLEDRLEEHPRAVVADGTADLEAGVQTRTAARSTSRSNACCSGTVCPTLIFMYLLHVRRAVEVEDALDELLRVLHLLDGLVAECSASLL